ncbi:lytic transglycosylase domain-containing protein [Actinokineospora spheciospongiae]|uniref:lytic transglycosylase domain-containing protein n=1 Tax=Actinokineospora spheciospongiae TaxID=909613 RepID=UPI001F40D97D|nr:lytic murein transglycosylase [Actinokineospora spheciospongiae]
MAASPTPPPTTYPEAPQPGPTSSPPPRPRLRGVGRVAVVLAVLVLGAGFVVFIRAAGEDPSSRARPYRFVVPAVSVAPGTAVPTPRPVPTTDRAAWLERMADRTDMPVRTVQAYVEAEARTRTATPGCNLTWITLAGVGRVESHHGLYNGTEVGPDGDLTKPIVGVPLDGSPGVQAIPDTDQGRLDGDPVWDRAVGSMQFLPSTWTRWSQRSNGDGRPANPQNVDDAALTAARYLCASGGDLATGQGWWKAILTYNASNKYARDVYSGVDAYAKKTVELG